MGAELLCSTQGCPCHILRMSLTWVFGNHVPMVHPDPMGDISEVFTTCC